MYTRRSIPIRPNPEGNIGDAVYKCKNVKRDRYRNKGDSDKREKGNDCEK